MASRNLVDRLVDGAEYSRSSHSTLIRTRVRNTELEVYIWTAPALVAVSERLVGFLPEIGEFVSGTFGQGTLGVFERGLIVGVRFADDGCPNHADSFVRATAVVVDSLGFERMARGFTLLTEARIADRSVPNHRRRYVGRGITDPMAPSHVLVPLDGSPLADEALSEALELFDCRITVLNVVTPIDASMSEGGMLEPDDDRRESARERVDCIVDRARRQAAEVERTVETAVEIGDPAETILKYVETHDVDRVVMGGHGGNWNEIARRLLGTVATSVVSEVPVTVTVVR